METWEETKEEDPATTPVSSKSLHSHPQDLHSSTPHLRDSTAPGNHTLKIVIEGDALIMDSIGANYPTIEMQNDVPITRSVEIKAGAIMANSVCGHVNTSNIFINGRPVTRPGLTTDEFGEIAGLIGGNLLAGEMFVNGRRITAPTLTTDEFGSYLDHVPSTSHSDQGPDNPQQ